MRHIYREDYDTPEDYEAALDARDYYEDLKAEMSHDNQ